MPGPTESWISWLCIAIFAVCYIGVMFEERLHLRKSVPVMVGAGAIWVLVAILFGQNGRGEEATHLLEHVILEFSGLFLFLLSAITFVNTLEERDVFDALRSRLIRRRLSLRKLFWVTGAIAFVMSPIADNLTTALVIGSVAIAVGGGEKRFITPACINIVVAANAGGAFSPFGDITTLMLWQAGKASFTEFFALFIPSLVNWLVPALIMSFFIPNDAPQADESIKNIRPGGRTVTVLFVLTIAFTVIIHSMLHLPAALGMMTGLGCLKLYAYRVERLGRRAHRKVQAESGALDAFGREPAPRDPFDVFKTLQRVEWDTLMFFYGVLLCVGGLAALGWLTLMSESLYVKLGPMWANVLMGAVSAIVDNIPVTYAVITMNPSMNLNEWLLFTLAVGVGGSMLSVGSAAGVALMGSARGQYTFVSHLKWSWAVALGYLASMFAHVTINGS